MIGGILEEVLAMLDQTMNDKFLRLEQRWEACFGQSCRNGIFRDTSATVFNKFMFIYRLFSSFYSMERMRESELKFNAESFAVYEVFKFCS